MRRTAIEAYFHARVRLCLLKTPKDRERMEIFFATALLSRA